MKITDYSFQCKGQPGDIINIHIKSEGTQHQVKYNLYGQEANLGEEQPLEITLEKPNKLKIDLIFSESKGGTYYIEVMGFKRKYASYVLKQNPGEAAKIINFELEGDETTDADKAFCSSAELAPDLEGDETTDPEGDVTTNPHNK